jgi:transcription termination factor Rho
VEGESLNPIQRIASEEKKTMTIPEIKKMAKKMGIKAGPKMKKAELIRQIQRAEGNFDCFGTAVDFCDQYDCLWRQDCLGKTRFS